MMIGASIINEMGKTTPPWVARLISGCAKRAMTAVMAGISMPINNQEAAKGSQVCKILRICGLILGSLLTGIVNTPLFLAGIKVV